MFGLSLIVTDIWSPHTRSIFAEGGKARRQSVPVNNLGGMCPLSLSTSYGAPPFDGSCARIKEAPFQSIMFPRGIDILVSEAERNSAESNLVPL